MDSKQAADKIWNSAEPLLEHDKECGAFVNRKEAEPVLPNESPVHERCPTIWCAVLQLDAFWLLDSRRWTSWLQCIMFNRTQSFESQIVYDPQEWQ